jgi:hypothetical protein
MGGIPCEWVFLLQKIPYPAIDLFRLVAPPDNNTGSGHHLASRFCGANRTSTPILHGRHQQPEGMAI